MKRFYKTVGLEAGTAGVAVTLDGRPLRTPLKAPLVLPNDRLAQAVADEWAAQGEAIKPHEMAMMRFASTAIDRVAPRRADVAAEAVAFAGADLLCYRAAAPAELVARQAAVWQPLLDWAAARFGAGFVVIVGVVHLPQPETTLAALRQAVAGYDAWALTALHVAAAAAGSLVIGLALLEGEIGVDDAFAAAFLDEIHQAERWGEDHEALQRRQAIRADLENALRFHVLSRS